jgi:mannan endo-1,4-beta-mannosidase
VRFEPMDDPCATLQQKADDLLEQINSANAAFNDHEIPQPRTPANIASFHVAMRQLANRYRIASVALKKCRSTNPPIPQPTPHTTLYVDGRFLRDRGGALIIPRGVNLPLLDDWSFPGSDYLDAVAGIGANVVRIQWYINYPDPDRPSYTIADLDGVLTRCKALGLIAIVQLADFTCQSDVAQLNAQIIPWWTSDEVAGMLNKHQDNIILNLANELGFFHWAADSAAALSTYVSAYGAGIARLRTVLSMPVMIDAPDCGTSLDAFVSVGQSLVAADPLSNILLSVHAYWAAVDYTSAVSSCVSLNLPVIFGEIADRQDDTDDDGALIGYYQLDGGALNIPAQDGLPSVPAPSGFTYQSLLTTLQANQIGWLAWSWGPDQCDARMLSGDGTSGTLTQYGADISTNKIYGLTKHPS